jgi:type VI secretion system secreted protein Hcp
MAAVDYFLKLDGIVGDSSDNQHKDEIEVLSFSWGLSNTGSVSGGGGAGAGRASLQDFHFVASFGKASPQLMLSCATGKHIREAVLSGRGARGSADEFIKVRLSDLIVTSYQTGATDDAVPTDQFSLNFSKIEYAGSSFDAGKIE